MMMRRRRRRRRRKGTTMAAATTMMCVQYNTFDFSPHIFVNISLWAKEEK
jgi:hypothetical protein